MYAHGLISLNKTKNKRKRAVKTIRLSRDSFVSKSPKTKEIVVPAVDSDAKYDNALQNARVQQPISSNSAKEQVTLKRVCMCSRIANHDNSSSKTECSIGTFVASSEEKLVVNKS